MIKVNIEPRGVRFDELMEGITFIYKNSLHIKVADFVESDEILSKSLDDYDDMEDFIGRNTYNAYRINNSGYVIAVTLEEDATVEPINIEISLLDMGE